MYTGGVVEYKVYKQDSIEVLACAHMTQIDP